ncbi:hypothetical protein B0W47_08170 [Komagataeibacter nataicola]|uniref:Uncharacterized protein n=1 Tax=Komagataeibacter nataicola TaxID=265960 RepID=A0A9N7CLB1_9PROT|nr:hypothetical protein B0W47_08170 [Komagataeibacter nataicola]PYD65948.1 hypothetical protein CDI09_10640 [Komagataeibacter nataicola]
MVVVPTKPGRVPEADNPFLLFFHTARARPARMHARAAGSAGIKAFHGAYLLTTFGTEQAISSSRYPVHAMAARQARHMCQRIRPAPVPPDHARRQGI